MGRESVSQTQDYIELSLKELGNVNIISFKVDPELKRRLDITKERMSTIAKRKVSRSEIIRMALEIGLKEIEKTLDNVEKMQLKMEQR